MSSSPTQPARRATPSTELNLRFPPVPEPLRVILYPDPVLRKVAHPVQEFGADLEKLGALMTALMHESQGVGLAAPQVGLGLRVFVYNVTGEPGDDVMCVNPMLLDLDGVSEDQEGCLSLPGVTVTMRRAKRARLRAQDVRGQTFEVAGEDLLARVWQHEFDHLEGRLIIDAMSAADEIANRRQIKQLREDASSKK